MSSITNDSKYRVLLVEEEMELSRSVMTALTKAGMQCFYAPNIEVGMEAFKTQSPHIVLLGLGMPRLGGVVMCPQVRAISTVPITILSVRTATEDQLHALNFGADDYLIVRPLDEQVLVARVMTLLRRVYTYDGQQVQSAGTRPQPAAAPDQSGWVTCESCGYLGPEQRFNKLDASGNWTVVCPNCKETQNLRFDMS
jgi:two-component system KDP operon response regulator KdpE